MGEQPAGQVQRFEFRVWAEGQALDADGHPLDCDGNPIEENDQTEPGEAQE